MRMQTLAPSGTNLRPRLERNDRGRGLVVAGVHGYGATLRRGLAELEVDEHNRVSPSGTLSTAVRTRSTHRTTEPDPSTRLHAVPRGNHEQMMIDAFL